jgi:glycerol-3-phosphate dehydrogenase
VVAWTPAQLAKLPAVLAENRAAGDTEAELLTAEELADLEPSLAGHALGAVLCPREAVSEPWLVPLGYAESARLHGADLRRSTEVTRAARDAGDGDGGVWRLATRRSGACQSGRSKAGEMLVANADDGGTGTGGTGNGGTGDGDRGGGTGGGDSVVSARIVINCAGLFGDVVETVRAGGRFDAAATPAAAAASAPDADADAATTPAAEAAPFHVTPRKGQFVVFKPQPGAEVPSFIVEPVATQFTKGVIIWTTVYGNVIVGPTAVDQRSRGDRSTDPGTVGMLRQYGAACVPALAEAEVVGTYSGLRPATEHRDYQIAARPAERWITVGGIRSTGLTCASGIGEYVAELFVAMRAGEEDATHASAGSEADMVGVTEAANNPVALTPAPKQCNAKVPPLDRLAADYVQRNDGKVMLYGKAHRVTHPISSFGMECFGKKEEAK